MKRWLYLVHRWLGVLLCLFMAMWFFSGVVMMYVGYPKLTHEERLLSLSSLPSDCCGVGLDRVLGHNPQVRALRLTTVGGRPTFIVSPAQGAQFAIDARSGQRVPDSVGATGALASAQGFMPGVDAHHDGVVEEDAWTHSKALDAMRPLHRVVMGDAQATVLYVSDRTGEVVRDASQTERVWNWVGAWIHWLYPLRGGAVDRYWTDIVIYTSIVATLLSIVGLLVGVWRWRFVGTYGSGARTPYQKAWMRWHHVVGLLFGLTTITFIFSGLMSMNPFRVLDSGAPRVDGRAKHKVVLRADAFVLAPAAALRALQASGFDPVEVEWRWVQNRPMLLAYNRHGASRLLSADGNPSPVFESYPMAQMEEMGRQLMKPYAAQKVTVLHAYDTYYYRREPHTMSGGGKHLPILRMEFDDPHNTWLHLDPRTGAVVGQLDTHRRVGRWLFAFLHSWDWLPLLERRPLWDLWMWLLSLGGLVLSASGVVIGWRRLRIRFANLNLR